MNKVIENCIFYLEMHYINVILGMSLPFLFIGVYLMVSTLWKDSGIQIVKLLPEVLILLTSII